jgi:hypothetical protein
MSRPLVDVAAVAAVLISDAQPAAEKIVLYHADFLELRFAISVFPMTIASSVCCSNRLFHLLYAETSQRADRSQGKGKLQGLGHKILETLTRMDGLR